MYPASLDRRGEFIVIRWVKIRFFPWKCLTESIQEIFERQIQKSPFIPL